MVADGLGIYGLIDRNCYRPNQTIRCLGSVHADTGYYCVGYDGEAFLKMPLWLIESDSEMYVCRASLPDPLSADAVPSLLGAMELAADTADEPTARKSSRGMIAAWLNEGVERGERNEAANRVSLYLIQRHGAEVAWEMVQDWNGSHVSPPLSEKSYTAAFGVPKGSRRDSRSTSLRMVTEIAGMSYEQLVSESFI